MQLKITHTLTKQNRILKNHQMFYAKYTIFGIHIGNLQKKMSYHSSYVSYNWTTFLKTNVLG